MSRLLVTLDEDPPTAGARLLVPVPPETEYQSLAGIDLPDWGEAADLSADRGKQRALLCGRAARGGTVAYAIEAAARAPRPEQFEPPSGGYVTPPDGFAAALASVIGRAAGGEERERAVVAFVARHFRYGPKADTGDLPAYQCDLMTGNCIDIHGFLLMALHAAGVPAAYSAGYWFRRGAEPIADGMHCWVSTLAAGLVRYWDVAHHLVRNGGEVAAGLNPIPGWRAAMSVGRGFAFPIGGFVHVFGHLAQPEWILPGGTHRKARVTAELAGLGASH